MLSSAPLPLTSFSALQWYTCFDIHYRLSLLFSLPSFVCVCSLWNWIIFQVVVMRTMQLRFGFELRWKDELWHGHTGSKKSSFPVHCLSEPIVGIYSEIKYKTKWKKRKYRLFRILLRVLCFFFFFVFPLYDDNICSIYLVFICKQIGK